MTILIATGIFPPEVGGPATYVPLFARSAIAEGHSVRVITYGSGSIPSFPYPVISIPRLPVPFRHFLFFLACFRHGFSADVIFSQDAFSSGVPAACAAFLLRKSLIVKIVGDFSWEYARNSGRLHDDIDAFQRRSSYPLIVSLIRRFQGAVCRFSRQVIVPSDYLRHLVIGWGVDSRDVVVVRNAVSRAFQQSSVLRDPFLVFSAGRMVPWKGFDGLIRAFSAIAPSFPSARLVIAGDGPCLHSLSALASSSPVSSRISFPGSLSSAEMSSWYSRAGCFVLFSEYEGLSHVLLEALAHGIPVIASDAGGNRELITDGENGMLIPPRDENALSRALASLFMRPRQSFLHPTALPIHSPSPADSFHETCRLIERILPT